MLKLFNGKEIRNYLNKFFDKVVSLERQSNDDSYDETSHLRDKASLSLFREAAEVAVLTGNFSR